MKFIAEPVTTPCNHTFCLQCAKRIQQDGKPCPMCRNDMNQYIPNVDKQLKQEIMDNFAELFEERKEELV